MLPAQSITAPSPDAEAKPRSERKLYGLCEAEASQTLKWCEGYLLGLADVLVAMGNSHLAGGICDAEYDPSTLGRVLRPGSTGIWNDRRRT